MAKENAAARILGRVWDELKGPAAAGSHELANALFRGDAYAPAINPGVGSDPETQPEQAAAQPDSEHDHDR